MSGPGIRLAALAAALLAGTGAARANPAAPAFAPGAGPRVYFDEGHANGHRIDGDYAHLAGLLAQDGFAVGSGSAAFDAPEFVAWLGRPRCLAAWRLRAGVQDRVEADPIDVLALATARDTARLREPEVELLHAWLRCGGALFLVVEHAPFREASRELAARLGVRLGGVVGRAVSTTRFAPEPGHPIARGGRFGAVATVATSGLALGLWVDPAPPPGAPRPLRRALLTYAADARIDDPTDAAWQGGAGLPIHEALTVELGDGRAHVSGEASMYLCNAFRCLPAEQQNSLYILNVFRWLGRAICDDAGPCGLAPDEDFELRDADADGIPDADDRCIELADPDQRDADGDGYGDRCDADFDADGIAGVPDFLRLVARFGAERAEPAYDAALDLDGDGRIGAGDFSIFSGRFGLAPGPSAHAP